MESNFNNRMRTHNCSNIGACVDNAINVGNHEAFVDFFFNESKVKFLNDMFREEYQRFISGGDSDEKEWNIAHSNSWRGISLEEGVEFHSNQNKAKWWNGKSIPGKDELVQMGLYKGVGYEYVNRLLELSGQRLLYPVDIIDAIGMYYLELYKDNKDLSGEKKVDNVRTEIINRLKLIGEREINVDKIPVGYSSAKDINDEIEAIRERYKVNENLSDTLFITEYVKKNLEEAIDKKEFDIFFEKVKELVSNKQYGYLRRTLQFIDSADKYKKNLFYSGYRFTKNLTIEDINRMQANAQVRVAVKHNENLESRRKDYSKSKSRDYKLRLLNGIWNIEDFEEAVRPSELTTGSFFVVKNLIKGRKEQNKKDNENKDTPYIISNEEKLNIMKFAIVAGREDEIGEYLIRSGHKEDNLNTMLEKVYDDTKIWDKTESLIIYCLHYRDKLIRAWSEQLPEESRKQFEKEQKECFPVLQLLMNVNRKIQQDERYIDEKNKYLKGKKSYLLCPVVE